ncbi:MAG TPA: hypothetical protein VD999_00130 [Vitreimonas sp.]|nr:hypothetical protein [Vitreimonas sp.]
MLPSQIPDTLTTVKYALECWADWQKIDDTKRELGYSQVNFYATGTGWGHWVEDNETSYEMQLAEAIDAIMEDMSPRLTTAITHFHVAAVFTPKRTRIEDDYQDALVAIEVGMRARDLL